MKNWNPLKNNTTGEKSPVDTTQKNTPPRRKYEDSKQVLVSDDIVINARANLKKSVQPNNSIDGQQGGGGSMDDSRKVPQNRQDPVKKLDAVQSNKGTGKSETLEERKKQNKQDFEIDPELSKKLKAKRRLAAGDESDSDEHDSSVNSPIVDSTSHNGETGSQNTDQSHREVSNSNVQGVSGPVAQNAIVNALFNKVNDLFHQSTNLQPGGKRRSESPHGGYESDEDWDTDPEPIKQASSGSQSLHRERSGSLDSGIGSRATSPIYPEQKTEESPVPPNSCVDSPQVNNVNPVDNEVQDSPPLSVKDRIAQFGGKALRYQKENVVRG